MEALDLLEIEHWRPFAYIGLEHPFFNLNSETIIYTWIVLFIIMSFLIFFHFFLHKKESLVYSAVSLLIESFADFTEQTLDFFSFNHFSFIASLFVFIFMCNSLAIFPWLEEPTNDLNTPLSLGIISFMYVQWYAIKELGFFHYAREYFQPFFIMFPLHVIGKIATIISISFRLYGNIFGGYIISTLWFSLIKSSFFLEIAGLLTGNLVVIFFFGIFEGFLQAFVFSMLTLTYLSLALHEEESFQTHESSS